MGVKQYLLIPHGGLNAFPIADVILLSPIKRAMVKEESKHWYNTFDALVHGDETALSYPVG